MARDAFPVVAHVLMLRNGGIFLLQRSNTGFMDGYYGLPGGHQQRGEGVLAAARRECEEETGVRDLVLEPLCVMPYLSGSHQGSNFVFEAISWRGEPHVAEPQLFSHGVWASPQRLPEPHASWIADVLRMRADGVWFREEGGR